MTGEELEAGVEAEVESSDRAKAQRYDRLRAMAAGAADHETRAWTPGVAWYFAVMRSIRRDEHLWFGGATNARVRARAIDRSLQRAVAELARERRAVNGATTELEQRAGGVAE